MITIFPVRAHHLLSITTFIGVFLFSSPFFAQAQEIAILKSADIAAYNQAIEAFKTTLHPSLEPTLEYDLQGDVSRGRRIARKVRASDVELVLAVGLKAALVSKLEIPDIPIIFCMVLNPAKYELQASNMTGIAMEIPFRDQFAPLKSLLPGVTRIGVVYNPTKTARFVEEARPKAKALGLQLVIREVSSEQQVPGTLRALVPEIQALWLLPDSTVLTEDSLNFLLGTTLEANVPIIGFSPGLVHSGALVGAYVTYDDVGRQAAALANNHVVSRQHLPSGSMISPSRVHRAINLKMANFLGISPSPHILNRFDERY